MDVARSGPFCACRWLPSCSMVWMSPALVTGGGARSGLAQRRGCGPATGQARLHDLRHAGPALDRDRVAGFSPCCSTWALDTPGQHHTRENRPPGRQVFRLPLRRRRCESSDVSAQPGGSNEDARHPGRAGRTGLSALSRAAGRRAAATAGCFVAASGIGFLARASGIRTTIWSRSVGGWLR